MAGGCHLSRPSRTLIEGNGFAMSQIEIGYVTGPKPMSFLYERCAKPV